MLFIFEVLAVVPALLFNGSNINIYTPNGIVPMTLIEGEVTKIHVPDFHTILTFKHNLRKVSYRLIDLLYDMSIYFSPLPLVVKFNIFREIQANDIRASVIGHRGSGSDTYRKENNFSFIPENTVTSFQQAFKSGADWVEMDILMTSDGEIVIYHDYEIDDIPIWNMTYCEFQQLAPYQTTFAQMLSTLDPKIKILVEFKYPSAEEISDGRLGSAPDANIYVKTALKIIKKKLKARVMRIMSFEPEILLRLRDADEDLDLYFLTEGIPNKFADPRRNSLAEGIQFCEENDFQGIVTDTDTINADPVELTAAAHNAGLQLLVYWYRVVLDGVTMVSEIVNFDCADVDGLIVDNIRMAKTVMDNMKSCQWTKNERRLTHKGSSSEKSSLSNAVFPKYF